MCLSVSQSIRQSVIQWPQTSECVCQSVSQSDSQSFSDLRQVSVSVSQSVNHTVSHSVTSDKWVCLSVSQSIRQSVIQWPQTSECVCQLVNQIVSHPMNSDIIKLHCMKSVGCKIPVCCRSQSLDCQLIRFISQKNWVGFVCQFIGQWVSQPAVNKTLF